MFSYTFYQWLLFFYIYCFIGWIIESTIISAEQKKFVNRGFLRIPFIPLYGFGAISMLFSSLWVRDNPTLVFICGALSSTLLEYTTGIIMESIFKMKYWDYSDIKFNIKGRICLLATFFWGFLTLFLMYQLHAFVEKIVLGFSEKSLIITLTAISLVFVADVVYSIKTAFDIKAVLARLTEIRAEVEKSIVAKVEGSEKAQAFIEKSNSLKAEYQKYLAKMTFYPRSLMKAYPRASSKKFSDALKELKASIQSKKK